MLLEKESPISGRKTSIVVIMFMKYIVIIDIFLKISYIVSTNVVPLKINGRLSSLLMAIGHQPSRCFCMHGQIHASLTIIYSSHQRCNREASVIIAKHCDSNYDSGADECMNILLVLRDSFDS